MKHAEPYQYVTPTVQSSDPRMVKAIDGWLGLYEACYVIGKAMREGVVDPVERERCRSVPNGPHPVDLLEALIVSAEALNNSNAQWAAVGGLALNYHGRDRASQNIDFLLLGESNDNAASIDSLLSNGLRRHPTDRETVLSATGFRWVPLEYGQPTEPVNVDVFLARNEFVEFLYETGIESKINGMCVRVVGPEGFLVFNLVMNRAYDRADVEELLRKKIVFDQDVLNFWVKKFSLETPLSELQAIVKARPGRLG